MPPELPIPRTNKGAEAPHLFVYLPNLLTACGAPGEIRTPDHQVRSLVLYPAELRAQKRNYGGAGEMRQRFRNDWANRHVGCALAHRFFRVSVGTEFDGFAKKSRLWAASFTTGGE